MSALPPKADIGTGPRYQLRRDNSGSLTTFAATSAPHKLRQLGYIRRDPPRLVFQTFDC
jgi:hypothetical protein